MRKIQILILALVASLFTFAYADDDVTVESITNSLQKLVREYEAKMSALQKENAQLKSENESLKRQFGITFTGTTQSVTGSMNTGVVLGTSSTSTST
jgi:cell division protein FtsB